MAPRVDTPTVVQLAHQRDRLRTAQKRRRALHQRLADRLHKVSTSIQTGARKLARLDKKIKRRDGQHSTGKLSGKGAEFITRFEGEVDHTYNDPVGHCTSCVGHLVSMAPCASQHDYTHDQCQKLLMADAAVAAAAVVNDVKVPLTQPQFDALVSFTFNEGTGSLASSTLLQKLNAGDYGSVPSELMRWTFANGQQLPGLVTRRKTEGELFAHGTY